MIVGPVNYFLYPGSFNHPNDFFTDEQLFRVMWIHGERAIAAAQTKLPPTFGLPRVKHTLFRGHCNESDVQQPAAKPGDDRSVVIGVGGDALSDAAKTLARHLDLPFVAAPTIATTCTAWAPFSVWYNDTGQALHYGIFDDTNFMVLVGPKIILNAPQQYLLVGTGDTLAKWYEVVVLAPQPETLPLTMRLGINNARAIRDVLLNSSEQILADQQNQQLTQSFCGVVDAVIAGGGTVGGLDDYLTCAVVAYAVHNDLTVLPQIGKFLHSTKVAYGTLVQSTLLGQNDALVQLTGAYQRFHLPATLVELEVDIGNQAEIDKVIVHTLRPVEPIHYLPVTLTPDTSRVASGRVESSRA